MVLSSDEKKTETHDGTTIAESMCYLRCDGEAAASSQMIEFSFF